VDVTGATASRNQYAAAIGDPSPEQLQRFSPLRRRLLTTAGSLQATLSEIFGSPVSVVVLHQEVLHQEERERQVDRMIDLVCAARGIAVCRATTRAWVTNDAILRLMREGTLGLGQITATLGVATAFELDAIGCDVDSFWRRYRLFGDGFSYRIHEVFPEAPYKELEREELERS